MCKLIETERRLRFSSSKFCKLIFVYTFVARGCHVDKRLAKAKWEQSCRISMVPFYSASPTTKTSKWWSVLKFVKKNILTFEWFVYAWKVFHSFLNMNCYTTTKYYKWNWKYIFVRNHLLWQWKNYIKT